MRIAVIPLLVAALNNNASATSMMDIGPLAHADEITVEDVLLGNTLAPEASKATRLFGDDFARGERFRNTVRAALIARLKAAGIPIKQPSTYSLGFGVFGGTFEKDCPSKVVVLVEARVKGPGDELSHADQTVLVVTDDASLESAVLSAVTGITARFLEARRLFRAAKP